jgi:two-component system, chemotaxis family, chemotaxis protein CheY
VRILIVDDSRTMRLILKRILRDLGHTDVAEAENGGAALEKLDSFDADVALVDWNMPIMNGFEFISSVREDRRFDDMKLMMVTSESSPRLVYEALKAGADEYAMKPITSDVIEGKLLMMGLE